MKRKAELLQPMRLVFGKSLDEVVDQALEDYKRRGEMDLSVHCVKALRSRRTPTKVKVLLSDDTFLVLHHDPRNMH